MNASKNVFFVNKFLRLQIVFNIGLAFAFVKTILSHFLTNKKIYSYWLFLDFIGALELFLLFLIFNDL